MIHIKDSRDVYAGHMRDLARGGAFIEPPYDSDTEIGQELILTIPYGLKKDHLKIRAKVARIQSGGIGVSFIKPTTEG